MSRIPDKPRDTVFFNLPIDGPNAIKTVKLSHMNFPVLHSDYIDWRVKLTTTHKLLKNNIEEFFRTIFSLANPDWIVEYIRVEINGKEICYDDLIEYDLKSAIRCLRQFSYEEVAHKNSVEDDSKTTEEPLERYLTLLGELVKKAQDSEESFYYYQIPVSEKILFESYIDEFGNKVRRIRRALIPYIRFIDLEGIDFRGVDIRDEDLSYTNINLLNISETYLSSASGTNLEGVKIASEIKSASLNGANIKRTYSIVDTDAVDIRGLKYDSTVCFLNSKGEIINMGQVPVDESYAPGTLHF